MFNVIHGHLLGQESDDGKSLCCLLDSPVHLENSPGSYSPCREVFVIHGSTTESKLKCQRLEEEARLIQEKEDERRRNKSALQTKSRQVRGDLLQMKIGDQDVFATP